ncbi:MAG: hypothetical protein NNA22_08760 [Nitrospira sp.]|nr:hypothetical protein [Nitrospira sp.]
MRLSIAIAESQTADVPALLRWLRTAAAHWVEADEEGTLYVAVFDDFPKSVEAVARSLSKVDDLSKVRIVLDGKPIVNHTFFYESLLCYGRSLHVPSDECHRWAMIAKADRSCADRSCVSPCWLICSACLMRSRDRRPDQQVEASSFAQLACHAEVEWCPRLRP